MHASSKLRILVLGYIVRRPLGGGTWPTLQYTLGLARLGHEVWFFEDSEDYALCYDPSRHVTDTDATFGLRYASEVFDRFGLGERWAYYDKHQDQWHGPCAASALDICASADLLINNSGINPIRPWLEGVPRRVYIDTDPAFEQVRFHTESDRRQRVLQHNVLLTLGENIPRGSASVPATPVAWQPTRQPVVLDLWPVTEGRPEGRLTTVMLWNSYAVQEYGGHRYGMKSESFAPYLELPKQTNAVLELAVGGADAPRDMLARNGWSVVDPLVPTADPWTYQRYLQESRAEFTVAKHGYVASNCGWFSERSAHYLASGRPVLTQETGFSEWLTCDGGLLPFRDVGEALQRIEEIGADYARHCREARAVAETYFDSDRVLTNLLEIATRDA